MENTDDRVCLFCGGAFKITPKQKRQVKAKWPLHCSRSCSKKTQHAKNHGGIRQDKNCKFCGITFTVTRHNSTQIFCSTKCYSESRFGDPKRHVEKNRERVNRILSNEKYLNYIKKIANSMAIKFSVDYEDILNSFFLALLEGQNTRIEHCAHNLVRLEYNRGITGIRKGGGLHSDIDLSFVKKFAKNNEAEMFEYLYDLKKVISEKEFEIVSFLMLGFNHIEIVEKRILPRRQCYDFFRKLKEPNPFLVFHPDNTTTATCNRNL